MCVYVREIWRIHSRRGGVNDLFTQPPGMDGTGLDNYLDKINCLTACLSRDDWISSASEEAIASVFKNASDIQKRLSTEDSRKLCETLKVMYPGWDLTRFGAFALRTFLLHPGSSESSMMCALKEFTDLYTKNDLYDFFVELIQTERLMDKGVGLMRKYRNDRIVQMLEAKTCVFLIEKMILENDEKLESYVKVLLENETDLLMDSLSLTSKCTGYLILTIIIKHLRDESDLRLWFTLLGARHIKSTSWLCAEHPDMMEALLNFFRRYASEAILHEGNNFSWNHSYYPLSQFMDILNFLLENDGLVGITINEFINKEINNFGDNYSFWLDVKSLL